MKLLFVASECAPFVKTGGLADVIGAVPKSLEAMGVSVKVLIPAYPALAELVSSGNAVMRVPDLFGGPARVIDTRAEGLELLLLDAPHLYDRPGGLYLDGNGADWADNHLRFGGLSRVGAKIAIDGIGAWRPDVVNAHDWQAGLVPVYLRQAAGRTPPTTMTIHNIAFQGLFDPYVMGALGLDRDLFTPEGFEYFGRVGFLKGGLAFAEKLTTVSPTYANEIVTPEMGMGLEGLLRSRQGDLSGILNGIDLNVWNPETDAELVATYSVRTIRAKVRNRARIEERFGLSSDPDAPLFCVISRLTSQKGLDLLLDCLPGLVGRGGRLALLGTGEKTLERAFVAAASRHAGSVGAIIGYDEKLSHLLQGGSDAILIPSRFEPCGLTQLYGLRYGTIPVVARTGGLADTVIDANAAALAASCATGVQFSPVNAVALDQAIERTIALYRQPKVWGGMVRRAMRHPVGWDQSAAAYLALFEDLVGPE
ncbi:glycogen synthase GlgA [Defluviimonas aestuarii]|uniref:glycogen synthase GlgA n=1 Tax=Albidovulum aestuarii TaxID=1130726 RepID=UPI00249B9FAC|nr:glycogen synthase GlgA [Defluviimonas aestuarii]MDI3336871.1 glycogen synthase GlgA [Defluviimonas aestuarii]